MKGADSEGCLLNPVDILSWPQDTGHICWHLDTAQPDRLVSVTVSQDHIMSQWTMVTSLKHPDMCSAIMQPNQCLWGDEWFQCNRKSESRDGEWGAAMSTPTGSDGGAPAFPTRAAASASRLSRCPHCLSLRRVWLTHFFFFFF